MTKTNQAKIKKIKTIINDFLKKMAKIETEKREIEASIQADQDAEKIKKTQQKINNL